MAAEIILIGLGANLHSEEFGPPLATCQAAVRFLRAEGLRPLRQSRWYRSAPVPASDQPWYVNGVILLESDGLEPMPLLALLHRVEARFGRVRGALNAARVLDLDLLAYGERVAAGGGGSPILPHPRLHQRAFVLLPLAEVAPGWRHPRLSRSVQDMIRNLPPEQTAEALTEPGQS